MDLSNNTSRGFIRAMARELLVHNPKIRDVNDAIDIAVELLQKTDYQTSHSHDGNDGRVGNS
jgi:hypothetical protein